MLDPKIPSVSYIQPEELDIWIVCSLNLHLGVQFEIEVSVRGFQGRYAVFHDNVWFLKPIQRFALQQPSILLRSYLYFYPMTNVVALPVSRIATMLYHRKQYQYPYHELVGVKQK